MSSRFNIRPMKTRLLWPILACFALMVAEPARAQYYHKSVQDWEKASPHTGLKPMQTVFLVGDAGALPAGGIDPVFALLKSQMDAAGKTGAVVFLGDNIYP